jgi:ABC-type transport system involved in multi-copper enzyme maturation permease subunit
VIQDVLRIITAEHMRVRRKMFYFIVPVAALLVVIIPTLRAYRLAIILHTWSWVGHPGSLPPPGLGEELSTLLHWFKWGNLPTASGAGLLAGLGIVLFLYVGAVWFGDDLSSGAIKQSAILRVKFRQLIWGKVLALMIYTAGTIIFVVVGALLVTVFLPEVPGRELRAFLHLTLWRNLLVYIAMAFLWTFFAAAVTIMTRSASTGVATSILWVMAEKELLENGQSGGQLFLAKVTPWSTSQSLLASVYDRFSWLDDPPNWVAWVTTPPYTKIIDHGEVTLYLQSFSLLLVLLLVYLLAALTVAVIGYYWRGKE